jgi:hypothetical protein
MRYKRTVFLGETDKEKYYNLYRSMPYFCKISRGGTVWLYKKGELLAIVAEYLEGHKEYYIILKNNLPKKEKILRKNLDFMVETHNFSLKFRGKTKIKEKVSGMTLEKLIEGHNLRVKLGKGMKFRRISRANEILREEGEEK